MTTEKDKIGPMKKVILRMEAHTSDELRDFLSEAPLFEFIYGVGTQGLSPLEVALADRAEGESFDLLASREQIHDLFHPFFPPPLTIPDEVERCTLTVTIVQVSNPDPREVIKAMAEAAACGSGCCGR